MIEANTDFNVVLAFLMSLAFVYKSNLRTSNDIKYFISGYDRSRKEDDNGKAYLENE